MAAYHRCSQACCCGVTETCSRVA